LWHKIAVKALFRIAILGEQRKNVGELIALVASLSEIIGGVLRR